MRSLKPNCFLLNHCLFTIPIEFLTVRRFPIVQVAHDAVVDKIAEYFYSGFLILVVKPALLQADDRDAVAAATVYLQVSVNEG